MPERKLRKGRARQSGDQVRVQAERYDKRKVTPPLQPMTVTGAQDADSPLGQGFAPVGQVMAHLAVLHPEEFEEVVVVQAPGAAWRQGGPRDMDRLSGRKNRGVP